MIANIFPYGEHEMKILSFPKNLEDTVSVGFILCN